MKIKFENLGTIKTGELTLDKNLIIFAGPNHSGKSYLAYLIYGLLKIRDNQAGNELYEKYRAALYQEFDRKNILNNYITDQGLSVNRRAFFKEHAELYARVHSQVLSDSMIEVFASKQLQPQIHLSETEVNTNLIRESEEQIQLNGINYRCRLSHEWFEILSEKHQASHFNRIKHHLYDAIIFSNHFNVYFFPAERSALNLLSKDVVKEKALERDKISRRIWTGENLDVLIKSLNSSLKPHYPLAINDYIYFINELKYIEPYNSEYATLADEIEKSLMYGKVSVNEYGELQFQPKKLSSPFGLHMASSLVKSLAGLVIYFRHLARKNDVILIDEPELNLHPGNQRRVAQILAKAVNLGFKIILSTHSSYIIKEFNNLIMLSKDGSAKKDLLKQYGYEEQLILAPETVGAYFFNNHTIQSLPVLEKGFVIETINEEIDELEDTAMNIYFELFDN